MKKYIGNSFDDNWMEHQEVIDGMCIIDEDGVIITADEDVYKFLGVSTNYCLIDFIHQVDTDDFINIMNNMTMDESNDTMIRMQRVDDSYRWMLVTIKRICISDNDYYRLSISDAFMLRDRYNELTDNDELEVDKTNEDCNIYTVMEIYNSIQDVVATNEDAQLSLISLIVDDFDKYSIKYGQQKCDDILHKIQKIVADLICYRGRVGVDNGRIVFWFYGGRYNNEIRAFLEMLRTKIKWELKSTYPEIGLSLSLGAARYPQNGRNIKIVIKKEEKALNIAIAKGGSRYIIYREHLHGEITE